jgi:hypothetical protein
MEELSMALIAVPPASDASLLAFSEGGADCAAAPIAQSAATPKAITKVFMETLLKFQIIWRLGFSLQRWD